MSNFTLQDVAGSVFAVAIFSLALYVPGYVLGYAFNLVDFRRKSHSERLSWSVALSFAVTPLMGYFAGRFAGLNAACGSLLGLMLVWTVLVFVERRTAVWSRSDKLLACIACLWIVFVIFSLVDIQVGHRLYFSVVEDDQSYRVAFTGSVLRTGVPPANPLYFPGHSQPMRYYYYWYVVCAMVARIGHTTARQAFIASNVWAGFGMAAVVELYVRYFLGAVKTARRQTVIAVALLAVTGADLLPAIGAMLAGTPLNGDMEWWSNDQISSWIDSLLWVPHHVASLLCCLMAFLLLWLSQSTGNFRVRATFVVVAAIAFASGFGLSVYVAFGFAVLMLAWMLRLLVSRSRNPGLAARVGATGAIAAILLAPFLLELMRSVSGSEALSKTSPGQIFAFSIRRMIDPGLLTGLPWIARWSGAHAFQADVIARLILLLPGLALELGFYGAVLWMYVRRRGSFARDGPQRTALYLAAVGLLMALFVRSAVIGNNDFGYRVALLPQFFLLVLASDLLASWWLDGSRVVIAKTRWNTRVVYSLLVLGAAGTAYQAVMLRIFVPLEARQANSGFGRLPEQVFATRAAFSELNRISDAGAVVEFDPVDPGSTGITDVVPPYAFYLRSMLMNANRQTMNAEPQCAAEFGGDSSYCVAVRTATAQLYSMPSPSAAWAQDYCRAFGVDYLAAGEMDPAWRDPAGWSATLPLVASEPGFRILRCR